jgi:hypothetical protein
MQPKCAEKGELCTQIAGVRKRALNLHRKVREGTKKHTHVTTKGNRSDQEYWYALRDFD